MMVKTQAVEFFLRQGDTFNPRFYLEGPNGEAIDPTGMVFEFNVIKTLGSEAVTLERTSADGGIVVAFDTTKQLYYAQPVISATDSAALATGRYQTEFRITDSAGIGGSGAVGPLHISREIDR